MIPAETSRAHSMAPIAKSPTIPMKVAEQIIGLIRSGVMQQGERLPSEEAMTKLLGISRITLREAKKLLEARGYIQSQGKGRRFVNIPGERERTSIEDLISIDSGKIWELLHVRRILDSEAAFLASTTATRKEKGKLRTLCRVAIEQGLGERQPIAEEGGRLYAEFFETLVSATHNTIFSELRKSVDSLLEGALPYGRKKLSTMQGSSKQILEQLCTIVDAIEGNRPAAAKEAMISHIDYLEKTLRKALSPGEE